MSPVQQLEFVDTDSFDLGDLLGIEHSRRQEISLALDALFSTGKVRVGNYAEMLKGIEAQCYTHEEFVWAYANHLHWLIRTGRFILL